MIEEINGDFLQWLRGFFYTAQQGSVSRAAEIMGRGQSSISHHIACLEREMGVHLFDRAHGRMKLTAEGRRLRERAVEIFETIQRAREDLNPSGHQLKGEIKIVTTHAVLLYFLPPHIAEFMKAHPGVQFDLDGGGVEHILDMVLTGEADFGIASLESVPANLAFEPIFKTQPMLIAPRQDHWHLGRHPSLPAIAKCPFVAFPDSSTISETVTRLFDREGLSINKTLVLNNFELVKKYVEMGLGIAILDEYALADSDHKSLRVLELKQFFPPRAYGIISRRKAYASAASKAFRRTIMAAG